jgi:microcystin-dependent protein
MAQPYVGEIRMFAGNFPPSGWLFCDGSTLPISEYETLFQLIGTTYGGDGESTFNIPDLRGRIPVHQGTNPATGTNYQMGEMAGVETVTLTTQQMPQHNHALTATTNPPATQLNPGGNLLGNSQGLMPYIQENPSGNLNGQAIQPAGGSQPHENMQPYLGLNYIISPFGIFPSPT